MSVGNGEIWRVTARMQGPANQDIINTYYFRITAESDMADEDFAAAVVDQLTETYGWIEPAQNQHYQPVDINLDRVAFSQGKIVTTRTLGSYSWGVDYSPDAVTDPVPAGVALLIRFGTAGVRTLGRKFLAGFHEGNIDHDGYWGSTVIGYAAEFASDILDDLGLDATTTMRAVVHSLRADAWLPFISATISAIPGYQRRRRPGVGS